MELDYKCMYKQKYEIYSNKNKNKMVWSIGLKKNNLV
jgi:hypothetical protein